MCSHSTRAIISSSDASHKFKDLPQIQCEGLVEQIIITINNNYYGYCLLVMIEISLLFNGRINNVVICHLVLLIMNLVFIISVHY